MEEGRIFVTGPSGSGKTFLAKKLSDTYGIPHTNLDYVLFRHTGDKHREEVPEREWKNKLKTIVKGKAWIIEGVNPIKEVMEAADKIIYLRLNIIDTLFSQWKRYFTDPIQRKEHGFINNLKLSGYLIKQHIEAEDLSKSDDPKYSRVKKTDRLLKDFAFKVVILKTRGEVNKFIASL